MNDQVLTLENIHKSYKTQVEVIDVLKGVNLTVKRGERVIITGPSGSGKSTLLHIAGLLDIPDRGLVKIKEITVTGKSDSELSLLRSVHIGFVFQFHHLLADFTILDNVAMPLLIRGEKPREARDKSKKILEMLGISHIYYKYPSEVSGGEQQRAAIARAIIGNPDLLLLDEPTGNLDRANTLQVMSILRDLNEKLNITIVMVSHNLSLVEHFHVHYILRDGVLIPQ
ncbi:MAG: ABC transporter ATP-binding protein [candidate division WOR-3 bacterium]